MYSYHTLSNGIRVGIFTMDSVKSVAIKAMLTAGPVIEDESNRGASHFIEHVVLTGTKSYPNKKDFAEKLEEYGVSYNGYTSTSEMAFEFDVPYINTFPTLDMLKEVLFFPRFDKDHAEKERLVILEEMQDRQNAPDFQYYYACMEERYSSNHPLTRQVIGTKEVLSTISLDELHKLYERLFDPSNIYLCIVGNVDSKKTIAYLEKEYGSIGKKTIETARPKYSMSDLSQYVVKAIQEPRFTNVYNTISFPGFPQEMDEKTEIALRLFSLMFGGLRTSKLFQDVREKEGLVYSIGADWSASWGVGTFSISFEADAANLSKILDIVFDDITQVKSYKFNDKDLEHAKRYMQNRLLLSFSTPWKINQWILEYVFDNRPVIFPEDLINIIEGITMEDIKAIIDTVFDMKRMNVIMMGKLDGFLLEKKIENIMSKHSVKVEKKLAQKIN